MSPRCLPPTSPLTSRTTFKFTPPNLLHGVESDANTAGTGAMAWKTIPSWAVVGTEDRVIPPATQRRTERAGSTVSEVAASHVSSDPGHGCVT